MNVIFRADASPRIGAGHVTRCLTLAAVLGGQGVESCFVCRHLPDSLAARISSHGHGLVRLPAIHMDGARIDEHWLGTTQEEDARETRDILRGRRCDWLVVDHYALDFRWQQVLRDTAAAIMVVDDLADRRHECDLLLDQNYYRDMATRYEGLLPPDAHCLLGPKYALLQPQFAAARVASGSVQSDRLFVSVGAYDPFRICKKVTGALRTIAPNLLGADIVTGADSAARGEALACTDGLPGVSVYGFVDEIAAVMARCTLAIGAAGSSTWERCAVGLPSIVVTTADNQRKMAADLAQSGVIVLLGEGADISSEGLAGAIVDLLSNPVRRSGMRLDAMNLVDGQGAYRVTNQMMKMARCTN